MTRLSSIIPKHVVTLLVVILSVHSYAQDLFDIDHSRQFAKYLFQTKQYDLAVHEYERIVFLSPSDTGAGLLLIRSYRLGNNYSAGINRVKDLFKNIYTMPEDISLEYTRLLILNSNNNEAFEYLNKNAGINNDTRSAYMLGILLLKKDWPEANTFINNISGFKYSENALYDKLVSVTEESSRIKYKKPGVALGLSAIIPGTGKFYTRNRADGLISFLFIAGNAWNTYRGFKKYGMESSYGWIFGSITFCFYAGNIYGSFKAAGKYNKKLDEEIYLKAKDTLYSSF